MPSCQDILTIVFSRFNLGKNSVKKDFSQNFGCKYEFGNFTADDCKIK